MLGATAPGQRHSLVEHDPEPHAHDRVHRGRRLLGGRPHRPSERRATLPAPRCSRSRGRRRRRSPRSDDERVQPQRSGNRPRRGAVLEGGERLRRRPRAPPGQRRARPVRVRIDRVLEPGDQLVRSPEDRPAARPPRVASRRPGSAGPVAPGATPSIFAGPCEPTSSPASWVPCRSRRVGILGARLGAGVGARVDGVVAGEHLAEHVRLLRVDARVEERDR